MSVSLHAGRRLTVEEELGLALVLELLGRTELLEGAALLRAAEEEEEDDLAGVAGAADWVWTRDAAPPTASVAPAVTGVAGFLPPPAAVVAGVWDVSAPR